jgi:hypothetical protein
MSDRIEVALVETGTSLITAEEHAPRGSALPCVATIMARGRARARRRRVRHAAVAMVTTGAVAAATVAVVDRSRDRTVTFDLDIGAGSGSEPGTETTGDGPTSSSPTTPTTPTTATSPSSPTPGLANLTLDWQTIEGPGASTAAVISIDDRFLMYTNAEYGAPVDAIWSSTDGLTWAPEPTSGLGTRRIERTAVGPTGVVAVASSGPGSPPEVSFSADGLTWTSARIPELDLASPSPYVDRIATLTDVAASSTGYVALGRALYMLDLEAVVRDFTDWAESLGNGWGSEVGTDQLTILGPSDQDVTITSEQLGFDIQLLTGTTHGRTPISWYSSDGVTWIAINDPDLAGIAGYSSHALNGGSSGFLGAVTTPELDDIVPIYSTDGQTWTSGGTFDELFGGGSSVSFASHDATWYALVVNPEPQPEGEVLLDFRTSLWASTDGEAWERVGPVTIEDGVSTSEPGLFDLSIGPLGWTASSLLRTMGSGAPGAVTQPEGSWLLGSTAWWSADGLTWYPIGNQPPGGFRAFAISPHAVIAVSLDDRSTLVVGTPRA